MKDTATSGPLQGEPQEVLPGAPPGSSFPPGHRPSAETFPQQASQTASGTKPRDGAAPAAPLPFMVFPTPAMEMFNPDIHLPAVPHYVSHGDAPIAAGATGAAVTGAVPGPLPPGPAGAAPSCTSSSAPGPDVPHTGSCPGECGASGLPLPLFHAARAHSGKVFIPRVEDCHALWDRYAMPDHIRAHCKQVANFAHSMANRAKELGADVNPPAVLAAGLLHDLGKAYCIAHGGNHAQLGASWVMRETRNGPIAQSILFHVHWPWEECVQDDRLFITMAIIYADKRVKHDAYVTLDERFEDLVDRYGVNDYAISRIEASHQQGKRIETAFSSRLGVDLHEYTADSGRLVRRA